MQSISYGGEANNYKEKMEYPSYLIVELGQILGALLARMYHSSHAIFHRSVLRFDLNIPCKGTLWRRYSRIDTVVQYDWVWWQKVTVHKLRDVLEHQALTAKYLIYIKSEFHSEKNGIQQHSNQDVQV